MKLEIIPPNVNQSFYKFTTGNKGNIIYGLGAIKGVGESAIESIIACRQQDGPFQDLFGFCQRIDLRKVNRRVLEALIKSGAFDNFKVNRASLLSSLDKALQGAEQQARNHASGQEDLFGQVVESHEDEYIMVKPWSDTIRLQGEKETLGLYLTGHPIENFQHELKQFTTARIAELRPNKDQTVVIAGFIVAIRTMNTKRGDRMAFISLDDRSGRIELAVFSDVYEAHRHLLQKDKLIVVEGEVSVDEYSGGYRMSARHLFDMEGARLKYGKHITLRLKESALEPALLEQLRNVLSPFQGQGFPIAIEYQRQDSRAVLPLGQGWRVRPCDELFMQLHEIVGKDGVVVGY